MLQGSLADFLVDSCSSDALACSSESLSDASDDACQGRGLLPSRRQQTKSKKEEEEEEEGKACSGRRRQRRPSMKSVYLTSLLPMSQMPDGFGFKAPKFNVRGFKLRKQEVVEEEEEEDSVIIGKGSDDHEEEEEEEDGDDGDDDDDDDGDYNCDGGDDDNGGDDVCDNDVIIDDHCVEMPAHHTARDATEQTEECARRAGDACPRDVVGEHAFAASAHWQQQQQQQQQHSSASNAISFRSLRMQRRWS